MRARSYARASPCRSGLRPGTGRRSSRRGARAPAGRPGRKPLAQRRALSKVVNGCACRTVGHPLRCPACLAPCPRRGVRARTAPRRQTKRAADRRADRRRASRASSTSLLTAFGSPGSSDRRAMRATSARAAPAAGTPRPQLVATRGNLRLQLPVAQARVTAIGFHAVGDGALALDPLGSQMQRGPARAGRAQALRRRRTRGVALLPARRRRRPGHGVARRGRLARHRRVLARSTARSSGSADTILNGTTLRRPASTSSRPPRPRWSCRVTHLRAGSRARRSARPSTAGELEDRDRARLLAGREAGARALHARQGQPRRDRGAPGAAASIPALRHPLRRRRRSGAGPARGRGAAAGAARGARRRLLRRQRRERRRRRRASRRSSPTGCSRPGPTRSRSATTPGARSEIAPYLADADRVVRPGELSRHAPGRGLAVAPARDGTPVAVINLLG